MRRSPTPNVDLPTAADKEREVRKAMVEFNEARFKENAPPLTRRCWARRELPSRWLRRAVPSHSQDGNQGLESCARQQGNMWFGIGRPGPWMGSNLLQVGTISGGQRRRSSGLSRGRQAVGAPRESRSLGALCECVWGARPSRRGSSIHSRQVPFANPFHSRHCMGGRAAARTLGRDRGWKRCWRRTTTLPPRWGPMLGFGQVHDTRSEPLRSGQSVLLRIRTTTLTGPFERETQMEWTVGTQISWFPPLNSHCVPAAGQHHDRVVDVRSSFWGGGSPKAGIPAHVPLRFDLEVLPQ